MSSIGGTPRDEVEQRVLDATMVCLARFGVAKTTLDDIAREAGCARTTIYRYFPGRAAVVAAAVDDEVDRLVEAVVGAGMAAASLEDAVTEMFTTAARRLTGHEVLQRALELEPEVILPVLSFEGGDQLFAVASKRFAPVFARFLPQDRAPRAAEWCTRVLLAYLHPDRTPLAMTDAAHARSLIRRHVMPAFGSVPSTPAR